MSEQLAIDVHGLTKHFGDLVAVDGVSLKVRKGDVFGFLGPNGSGKTTTIRMICGLLVPNSGSGLVLGHDVLSGSSEIKRRVGYMTQNFSLYGELTIEENLRFVARMYGMKAPEAEASRVIHNLGLDDRRRQLAGTLSGGWKQRLALGASVMHRPELLLLDEPTAGVDPKARRDFWDEIHRLAASGITVLVSTHYMDEAERCHRLAYLNRGRILAQGTGDELVADSGLATWQARSGWDEALIERLKLMPGVETVAPFGTRLHVSGSDHQALQNSVEALGRETGIAWQQAQPRLEDVFIHFMHHKEAPRDAA
jgi:ABC-2 type transport system ATP-binding protein